MNESRSHNLSSRRMGSGEAGTRGLFSERFSKGAINYELIVSRPKQVAGSNKFRVCLSGLKAQSKRFYDRR
jgi:hypothetical protein